MSKLDKIVMQRGVGVDLNWLGMSRLRETLRIEISLKKLLPMCLNRDLCFFWVSSLAYPNLLGTKGYIVVVVLNIHNMQISVRHIMVLNCFHYWWVMGPEIAEEQDVELLQEWDISIHLLKREFELIVLQLRGFVQSNIDAIQCLSFICALWVLLLLV